MNLHPLDIAIILVYLGGMAAMGVYFSRKNTNTEEYFVGGRSFSGWIIGLSMVGTSISSVTFIAFPADAFKTAWLRFLPNMMLPVGVIIGAYLFLPFFRRGKITSAYEYLEGRFGPSIRVYGCVTYIIGQLVRVSMILFLVSQVMKEVTGLTDTQCILVGGVFVGLYTIVGGIYAVIWTDVIQTVVLVLGGIFCLMIIIHKLPGGLGQIFSVAIEHGKFSFSELNNGQLNPVSWGFSLKSKTGTMLLIIGLTSWLNEYSCNQFVIQRYCASRSMREARKAMYVSACSNVPIWAFFMFLGTSMYVFFQVFPNVNATAMLTGEQTAEQILPFFMVNYLPPGITGIVIAAALAAAMSSLDSSINAISTCGIVDIYRRHLVKGREDRHYLKAAWCLATAAAVFMIGGALILANTKTKTLQDTGMILGALVGGGLTGMYMLGFFTKRGDARAVWMGILCTFLFTTWTILPNVEVLLNHEILPDQLRVPFDLYYTGIIGNLTMFVVGFLAATLFPGKKKDMKNLTVWTQDKIPLD